MSDGYTPTLTITTQLIEGVTLTLARTSGTDCDEIELIYKNPYPFHPLRNWNRLYLYKHLSTIPDGIAVVQCICVSPKEV